MSTWSAEGITEIIDDRYTNGEGDLVGDNRSLLDPEFTYTDMTAASVEAGDNTLTNDSVVLQLDFTCSDSSIHNYVRFKFENRNVTTLELEIEWQFGNDSILSEYTKS